MHKHARSYRCHDMTCETHLKTHLSEKCNAYCPVAHLRWLRWCPSGFSAHYITDFWFGREDSPNVLVHPPVILIQSYVVLLFPKTAGKCMMICLEELWRLFIVTSDKPNHDNPTHILSEWNEREYEPQSMSFCACEICIRCKHWICLWFDASVCMNKSVWPLLCKTSVLFLFRWASVCACVVC